MHRREMPQGGTTDRLLQMGEWGTPRTKRRSPRSRNTGFATMGGTAHSLGSSNYRSNTIQDWAAHPVGLVTSRSPLAHGKGGPMEKTKEALNQTPRQAARTHQAKDQNIPHQQKTERRTALVILALTSERRQQACFCVVSCAACASILHSNKNKVTCESLYNSTPVGWLQQCSSVTRKVSGGQLKQ